MPDSAYAFALQAFELEPGRERCLGELLKSLKHQPESVLGYSCFVSGGGACRYRLARAELETGRQDGESLAWLLHEFAEGDTASAADAGCWLTILFPGKGTAYIARSVELVPEENFYRGLYIDRLLEEGEIDSAAIQFGILSESSLRDFSFWQTASSFYDATGEDSLAIEAARTAYSLRMTPATGADLGWKLYFTGRDLIRENIVSEAIPFLYEASDVWSPDSPWAMRADSLIDLVNGFTSEANGWSEPL